MSNFSYDELMTTKQEVALASGIHGEIESDKKGWKSTLIFLLIMAAIILLVIYVVIPIVKTVLIGG